MPTKDWNPLQTQPSFADLGVPAALIAALRADGCTTPFPIQAATLPSALAGHDVLGRGRTGSGKTVAYAVPTVMAVAASDQGRRPGAPRALVLVPTRELARQVARATEPLARAMGLRVATVHGGVSQGPQVTALRRGCDVLVACPGRLEDLIGQRHCTLASVAVCVLDEADHLADLGFMPAVRRLLDQTPPGSQRLLFSATLDHAVNALVARYLDNPIVHSVDSATAPPPELDHHAFRVSVANKAAVVRELASGRERSLLFTRTKHGAKKLASVLTSQGVPAVDLHGNLSQAQRHRNLDSFAGGSARVLVATDVAARGLHVDEIRLVVHVDPPADHKVYLHRSGRTARAGATGSVVTLILPHEDREVATIIRQAGVRTTPVQVVPGAPQIAAVTGAPAEPVFRTVPGTTGGVAPRATAPPSARPGEHRGEGPSRPSGRRPHMGLRGQAPNGRQATRARRAG